MSDEQKRKIGLSSIGRTAKKVLIWQMQPVFIGEFPSLTQAAKELGLPNLDGLSQVATGKYTSTRGYIAKFKKDADNSSNN